MEFGIPYLLMRQRRQTTDIVTQPQVLVEVVSFILFLEYFCDELFHVTPFMFLKQQNAYSLVNLLRTHLS